MLGVGSWTAVAHLPTLEQRDDVEWVVAMDVSTDRQEQTAKRFPFAMVTSNVDEALAQQPDVVIVGATSDAHHQLVGAALDAGADVLCEKPFTQSGADAWSLVRKAEERDRHLLTSFGWNYMPASAAIRDLLVDHPIGPVEHIQVHMATALREMYRAESPVWGRPAEFMPVASSYTSLAKGAGYAQAQLTHALGLTLWLAPLRATDVFAMTNLGGSEVDMYDALSLRFDNGATGSVSGACCPAGAHENRHQLDIKVFGRDGMLVLDYDRGRVWVYRDESDDVELDLGSAATAYECDGPSRALIDLSRGLSTDNRSSGELAARTSEIFEAAYASARDNRPVAILD